MSDPRIRALARQTGIAARELSRYVEMDMVSLPAGELSDATLRRLRRIRRLRRDLGIEIEVVAIIIRLLDRIHELEGSQPTTSRVSARVITTADKT